MIMYVDAITLYSNVEDLSEVIINTELTRVSKSLRIVCCKLTFERQYNEIHGDALLDQNK